jgi:hypothetical protein
MLRRAATGVPTERLSLRACSDSVILVVLRKRDFDSNEVAAGAPCTTAGSIHRFVTESPCILKRFQLDITLCFLKLQVVSNTLTQGIDLSLMKTTCGDG